MFHFELLLVFEFLVILILTVFVKEVNDFRWFYLCRCADFLVIVCWFTGFGLCILRLICSVVLVFVFELIVECTESLFLFFSLSFVS